jgi:peptidoglycan/xylan/chitin deacetylase (PgdA/CDA1 family)
MSHTKRFFCVLTLLFVCTAFCTTPLRAGNIPNVYSCKKNDLMQIALTFDDGPHPRYTPQILDVLDRYGIRATFFIVGQNASAYPELLLREQQACHEIANHTYSHLKLKSKGEAALFEELSRTDALIERITGARPRLFRPPEGVCNPTIAQCSSSFGYKLILWNVDTRDWASSSVDSIVSAVKKNVKSGDILLFHDYIAHNSPTPQALQILIPYLLGEGFQFVTVSELLCDTE